MFNAIYSRTDNFCDFLFASLATEPYLVGSTLEEKNLLLKEQILSFKSRSRFRREAIGEW